MSISAKDRAIGSLLGLAIGDAMGITQEMNPNIGLTPEAVHAKVLAYRQSRLQTKGRQTSMEGQGPFVPEIVLVPGEYSDDTAMALCLADSLLIYKGFDASDVMVRFAKWLYDGTTGSNCSRWRFDDQRHSFVGVPIGVGAQVTKAIERYMADPKKDPYAGGSVPSNGSLMRVAPVPIYYKNHLRKAMEVSALQGQLTHNTPEPSESCAFLAQMIVRAIEGETLNEIIIPPKDSPIRNSDILNLGSEKAKWRSYSEDQVVTLPGRALWTLEAALWCLTHSNNFKDAIILAINLAGDADTVAAVTGQVAGALYGVNGIPKEWLDKLCNQEQIRARAVALFDRAPFDRNSMTINQDTSGVIVKPIPKL